MARPPDPEKRHALARAAVDVLQREGLSIPASRLAEALGHQAAHVALPFPNLWASGGDRATDILQEQAAFVMEQVNKHTIRWTGSRAECRPCMRSMPDVKPAWCSSPRPLRPPQARASPRSGERQRGV